MVSTLFFVLFVSSPQSNNTGAMAFPSFTGYNVPRSKSIKRSKIMPNIRRPIEMAHSWTSERANDAMVGSVNWEKC